MSLPARLKSPTAVLQFLDSADGVEIVKYFQEMKDQAIARMRSAKSIDIVNYAQGAADAAEKISDLKKDIKQYQDDVRSGKIKPPDQPKAGGK